MARLDDIQKKHDEAMAGLRKLTDRLWVQAKHSGWAHRKQATDAFAELRQYHTQLLCGIDLALQIERKT